MKKVLLTILLGGMLFSVCACGKIDNEGNNTQNNTELTNEKSKHYDDLTMTRRIGVFDDLWIDLPQWREDGSETCRVAEYYNYYILAITTKEDYNTFDELYENEVKGDLRFFVFKGTYEDLKIEKKEVTLSNGIKATKFEGIVNVDSYGTPYEYPVYGYYLFYNNYPIIVMSIEIDTDSVNNTEERKQMTLDYVDKAVETIRSNE